MGDKQHLRDTIDHIIGRIYQNHSYVEPQDKHNASCVIFPKNSTTTDISGDSLVTINLAELSSKSVE